VRVVVNTNIAIRHRGTIAFGTLVWLDRSRAGVVSEAEYRVGDFLSLRIELGGWDQSVMGIAEVRTVDLRPGKLNRFLLRLLEMRRSDRDRLEAWYQEQVAELEARPPDAARALDSQVGSNVPSQVERELTGADPSPRIGGGPGPHSTPSVSVTVGYQGSRRQALRAVLRAACNQPSASEPPRVQPPGVRVNAGDDPIAVELRYPSLRSLASDWNAWLFQGLAFVRHRGTSPELEQPAMVRLLLLNRIDITCPARVVVQHHTGFGVLLDLDPHQLESMQQVVSSAQLDEPRPGRVPALLAASASRGRGFWARLFGLEQAAEPLDLALEALAPPLEALEMDPAPRAELDALLARSDTHYLDLCDEVAKLLEEHPWSWPDLRERSSGSKDPAATAASLIILAHSIRQEAISTLRRLSVGVRITASSVEVVPQHPSACPACREHHGVSTDPVSLVRRGLPPYHLGCTCRLAQTLAVPEGR
jgi:hypothetical protein